MRARAAVIGDHLTDSGCLRGVVRKDAAPGVLIKDLVEILFSYAQLFEDFVKKPASYLRIAMYRNRGCPAVWMLPSGVAALLPNHSKTKFAGNLLQVTSFGRHKRPLHQHRQGAYAHLLRTLPVSFRRH